MERKIGQTFEYEGKKLQVKESASFSCDGCFFNNQCNPCDIDVIGFCGFNFRTDKKKVIFVEVQEQPQEAEQPQDLNLCKILKYCPKGTKFYSLVFGEETYFKGVSLYQGNPRPIFIYGKYGEEHDFCLSRKGHPHADDYGECCIFPSKEMRDWSKFTAPWLKKERFDPKTLKPFDKIIFKGHGMWFCGLFSHIHNSYACVGETYYKCVIPYNDDTKHLLGTKEEAPDFYKYWED